MRPLAVICALFAVCLIARADATLDPKTYASPNGRFTLQVDPSSAGGEGKATYTFMKDGKYVWGGERAYTLWEAVVFDSGMVGGYSYNFGYNGRSFGRDDRPSTLSMMVIDQYGIARATETRARSHPQVMSNPPSAYVPRAIGIVADASSSWFAVRLQQEWDSKEELWLPFDTATATRLPDVTPDQPKHGRYGFHRDIAFERVPGTPLFLVHWYIWEAAEDNTRTNSAQVALLDRSGRQVWALDLPGEYDGLKGEVGEWSWHWDLVRPGIVQSGTGDRSFWFHSYKLGERIEYAVEPDPASSSGWKVKEVSRAAAALPQARGSAELVEIERAPLGSFKLQAEAPGASNSPLHSLWSFAIASDGTMGAVRSGSPATLIIVRPDGTVAGEHSLATLGVKPAPRLAALPGSRWLLYITGIGEEHAAVWTFDASTPDVPPARLEKFTLGGLRTAAALPDGGFVGIAGNDWVDASSLTAFDAQGAARWSVRAFNPQDVCVTSDGRVAILHGINNTISFYKPDGSPDGIIDLKTCLSRQPNYVAGLAPDRDGGVVLFDFNGAPSVYRLAADGKVSEIAQPTYADGRAVTVRERVLASPVDGRLWVGASDALLRLGPGGKADLAYGAGATSAALLRYLNALSVQPNGSMYGINAANSAVHVFNKDGTLSRVLMPQPDDFEAGEGFGSIAVLGDGTVLYSPGYQSRGLGESSFVRFAPDGKRVGRERRVLGEVSEDWYAIPGTQKRWAVGYESIGLVDENGKVAKKITRRPGGEWLGNTHNAGVAPDGTLAVVCGPDAMGMRGPAVVCVFSPDGEPVKAYPIPVDSIMLRVAINASTLAVTSESDVYLIPLHGGPTRRFHLPKRSEGHDYWHLMTSPDGSELWARCGGLEILRYTFAP